MNLMKLLATLSLDSSEYEEGLKKSENETSSFGERAGALLSGISKAVAVASSAGAAAVTAITKDAVSSYGEYEQLIGGVETLFKDSADIVSAYADNAYKTAGVSANEYMATVTSFSASLLQSLEGDTEKAANYADMALTDMSDNANKMGTSMESIQNAYTGFAKQNYTMLDNLKLGYGGTKSEMERLIKDAELLDSSFKATRDANGELAMSYSEIIDAIHIVQTDMGITGTTAKEAATTIEGSVNSMKASWKNLLTGLGNADADLSGLVNNFTDSLETAFGNIVPVAEQALTSMGEALPQLVSNLLPKLTQAINNLLPNLIDTVGNLVTSIGNALPQITSGLVKVLPNLLQNIFSNIGEIAGNLLPSLAESLGSVLVNLPSMLVSTVDGLINGLSNMVTGIVDAVKKQAEDSIPEDLADGYVGKIQSNFENTFSEGMTNLKLAVANLIGNTEWADALENIKLASALQDKIVSDYNTTKENIQQYSFENFKLETEAKVNTAMSLLGVLTGTLTDDNGVVTGDISVAQSYINQINNLLGQDDAVTLEDSAADWILKIVDKYKDADGNIKSPESIKAEIEAELNALFGGSGEGETVDPIELKEQTYKAMATVMSGYTEETAKADKESIEADIEKMLKAAGIPEVTAKAIAHSSVEDGGIETWFRTGRSTSWDNSSFIEWMEDNGFLQQEGDYANAKAIAEVTTKYVMGKIDDKELIQQFQSYGLSDEDVQRIIQYTVRTDGFNDAIEQFKELTRQAYLNSLSQAYTEGQIIQMQNYADAIKGAAEAEASMADGMDDHGAELKSYNDYLNDATLALNAQREEAEEMWGAYYDLTTESGNLAEKQAFIEQQLEKDNSLTNRAEELETLREAESKYAAQLVEEAGGFSQLKGEQKDVVDSILASVDSWENATTIMGLNAEQVTSLKNTLGELATSGYDMLPSSIGAWVTSMAEADGGMDLMGQALIALNGNTGDLGTLLYLLSGNADLVAEAIEGLGESTEGAAETIDGASENIENAATEAFGSVSDAADDTAEAVATAAKTAVDNYANNIKTGKSDIEDEADGITTMLSGKWDAAALEATRMGTVLTSDFSGSMLNGVSGVEDAADAVADAVTGAVEGLPSDMAETGDSSGSNLDSSFGDWSDTIWATVDDVYEIFNSAFNANGLQADMSTWGYAAGEHFNWGIGSYVGSIQTTISSIVQSIESSFGSLSGNMYNSGYNAGQGFYNGLSAWGSTISNQAWSIANSVVQATNSALNSHSPSRRMMEAGGFAGEGFYDGLERWGKPIVNEAESIADGVADAFDSDYGEYGFDSVNGSIEASVSTANNQQAMIYALLMQYLPQLADMNVVLDGDKTVGAMMPKINRELAQAETMNNRGNAVYA